MKKSFTKRIKITRTGKVIRRHMGLGHCKSKRNGRQKARKRATHTIKLTDVKFFKQYAKG